MPASRHAAATIRLPRSWPSRPILVTSTRGRKSSSLMLGGRGSWFIVLAAGRADAHAVDALVLQPLQRLQQRLEGAGGERRLGLGALVRLERVEAALLEDALGLVGEQDRVAVEGDPHFLRMRVGGARRMRIDARR